MSYETHRNKDILQYNMGEETVSSQYSFSEEHNPWTGKMSPPKHTKQVKVAP